MFFRAGNGKAQVEQEIDFLVTSRSGIETTIGHPTSLQLGTEGLKNTQMPLMKLRHRYSRHPCENINSYFRCRC